MEGLRELMRALDDVDIDVAALADDELHLVVQALAALQGQIQARWLAVVGEVERRGLHRRHGARDAGAWLATFTGERAGAARRDVELAGRLATTPVVASALATGAASKPKAAELIRAADLPEDVQHELVAAARTRSVEQVAAAVQRARLEQGLSSVPVPASLSIVRRHDHAVVEAVLDLTDAEFVDVAVHAAVEVLDLPTDVPIGERRAKALAAIARFFLDHHQETPATRIGRPHVLVVVDLEVLEGRAGVGMLGSGGVVRGEDARRLAMDANVTRIITRGRSEPLDVGFTTRSVPPALAKAVIFRDRHCRFEHCAAPPWACDVHHRRPWAQGGPTSLDNLGLLCWFHHEHVHRNGADRLTADAEGKWYLAAPRRAASDRRRRRSTVQTRLLPFPGTIR
jgi:hypothetical protein